ncbi:MAG TPA: ATP-dependent DNA helicase [Candidatus Atribacteria bacterium]|nr:ATP-dependent DNA helicase [Candidatus Atribacteria bacterium]
MEKPIVRISVRNLVEFLLKSGDIRPMGIRSSESMLQGARLHRRLQRAAGEDYSPEVRLAWDVEFDDFTLAVEGIADGIIAGDTGVIIDEIKSTTLPLDLIDDDFSLLHWAQAKCYAWMYCAREGLKEVTVRLTYINAETDEIRQLTRLFSGDELKDFFYGLAGQYEKWASLAVSSKARRDESIRALAFPFASYRRGQRALAAEVYRAIRDKRPLFAQAPTGTGKTMSVLYPAVKAMGEGMGEKLFYLTAKTVTRQAAEQAAGIMAEKGLFIRSLTLTAKDKICLCDRVECEPEVCEYARGHYDRVNEAIYDILTKETLITRDILLEYAIRHRVCPFEYGLDISLWADLVICDYNYVFDPRAYLRRFFEYGGDYTLLIDEAHNLVDRAREMYSAMLSKKAFMEHRHVLKTAVPDAYKEFSRINKWFIGLRKSIEEKYQTVTIDLPTELLGYVDRFTRALQEHLAKNKSFLPDPGLIDLFFDCLAFLAVGNSFDERYVAYATRINDEVELKLFCLDPSYLINKACCKGRTAVFFSATLQPLDYYREMLGGSREDRAVCLPSPFPRENLCVMAAGSISTRYKDRGSGYEKVARYIKNAVSQMRGNYLVFFPSFEYMENVYFIYRALWPGDYCIVQGRQMDEAERERFLGSFETDPGETMTAFAVMGGIFSEGIDLKGDRLSGAIIVGVGLPRLSPENDLIARYFSETNGMGFEYAYMYPGMNRVLQAAGRVIRTEEDRGFVLLLDDRFLHRRYLDLFPAEWNGFSRVDSPEAVAKVLSDFFHGHRTHSTI